MVSQDQTWQLLTEHKVKIYVVVIFLSQVIFLFFFCFNFISIQYHTQKQKKKKNYLRKKITYNIYISDFFLAFLVSVNKIAKKHKRNI